MFVVKTEIIPDRSYPAHMRKSWRRRTYQCRICRKTTVIATPRP